MLLHGISERFDLLKCESKPNQMEVWNFLLSPSPPIHTESSTLSNESALKAKTELKEECVCSSYRHQIADSWLQLNANVDDKATFFTACWAAFPLPNKSLYVNS